MFWFRNLLMRFVVGLTGTYFVVQAFIWGVTIATNQYMDQDLTVFFFSYASGAAMMSVLIQMLSRWTLAEGTVNQIIRPDASIRAFLELTFLMSIGFACVRTWDFERFWEGALSGVGLGFLSSTGPIYCAIIYLDPQVPQKKWGKVTSWGICCALSTVFFLCLYMFGTTPWDVAVLSICSVGGIACGTFVWGLTWVGLRWMQICGWTCIRRTPGTASLPDRV